MRDEETNTAARQLRLALTIAVSVGITFGATGLTPVGGVFARVPSEFSVVAHRYAAVAGKCPGGVVTVKEENYYGVPSKTNPGAGHLAAFFNHYQKVHPCVKIVQQRPVTTGDAQYLTHVLSQFSSGTQPDLLMVDNPQLPEFASDNLLVPLPSLGSLGTVVSKLNGANVAETTYKGKLYALPLYTNTIAIFYNKTLLRKAGITTLPTTWAAFGADAKKLAHGKDLGFVFAGQAGPGQATWQFDPWAWSNGGSLLRPDGRASVQALAFLSGLVKEGAAPKAVVNWGQTQPIQEFEAGKAAFAENGLWNIPVLKSVYRKLNWGVFKIPTRLPHQTVIAPFGGEVWTIPKTNPREERAAFALLKAMSGNVYGIAKALDAVPTVTSMWRRAPWNGSLYAPFLSELRHGRSRTVGFKIPSNQPAVSLDIGNEIEAALIGKVSAAAAMKAAQRQVAPLLK